MQNITLHFKPGTKSAIVGSTGSGKTTILNLIGRLYDIDSGKITFNETDISRLSVSSVRDQITIVSQDIVIFDQSLETTFGMLTQQLLRMILKPPEGSR